MADIRFFLLLSVNTFSLKILEKECGLLKKRSPFFIPVITGFLRTARKSRRSMRRNRHRSEVCRRTSAEPRA